MEESERISHDVDQYVDDPTNIVGAQSLQEMRKYLEKYMTLLEEFYTINKLKINSEKTKFMVMDRKTGNRNSN